MPNNEECSHPLQNKSRVKISIRKKKKKQLNEQLYRIHLECAAHWPTTWQIIQSTIDNNIRQQMEMHYDRLNGKLDRLLQKQSKHSTPPRQDGNHHQFYTRVKNLTYIKLNAEELQILNP